MFADRTLYLAVNDGTFFAPDAYCFDEATGEITRNEGYEGVNALFLLPLDKGKADKEKAEAYLKQLEEELHGPAEDESEDQAENESEDQTENESGDRSGDGSEDNTEETNRLEEYEVKWE